MRVKIEQITPCDQFNMVGSVGVLDITTLGVGNRLEIQIGQSVLQTSTITAINKTESGVDVNTKNSLYQLTYL